MMKDKRGQMQIIIFFLILFTILIIGFVAVLGITVVGFASETITPVMEDLGMVGEANLSEASQVTFGAVDKTIGALPWLLVFSYVAMLVFSIVFITAYTTNPNPAYIGIYFIFIVLLVFGAIIMSNMYQDLVVSGDEVIGDGLREQKSMSYFMIHSPWIMGLIAFLTGIYIFAGNQREGGGGFDI